MAHSKKGLGDNMFPKDGGVVENVRYGVIVDETKGEDRGVEEACEAEAVENLVKELGSDKIKLDYSYL
ncbi:hypothetical protein HN51_019901 [Arachis hypogaea]